MSQNSVSKKNWESLERCRPDLAKLLRATPDLPAFSLEKLPSGDSEIFLNFADKSKKPFHGGQTPDDFARSLVSRLDFKNPRILIFLGLGLGRHIIETLKKAQPLNEAVLIFEPHPQIFKYALETTDLSLLIQSPGVYWCVGKDSDTLQKFMNDFFSNSTWVRYANAIEYVPLPASVTLSPSFFQEVQTVLPKTIGHHFSRFFGDPFDALLGTRNTMANLQKLFAMPSIEQARGIFAGKPGIVIASGPSLKETLPFLKQVNDRAVLAACPSALPALIDAGVHPHIWLNIERLEEQGKFFEDLPQKPPHIFVGPPLVHPRCFDGNGGANAHLATSSLHAKWLPIDGTPQDLGHSSAHAAFLILEILGCDPIYLVGQDLSYMANESHAPGVWDESQRMMLNIKESSQKVFEVEGNDGRPVQTNMFWFDYLKTFTGRLIPAHQGQVFNVIPTTHGAKIQGATRIDPPALVDSIKTPSWNVLGELEKTLAPPSSELRSERKKVILEKMDQTLKMLDRLIEDSRHFALSCKELQYAQPMISKRWDKAEPVYKKFLQSVKNYSMRMAQDVSYKMDRDTYQHFFHPVIQGALLRYQIEYFSSADDIRGNFAEISRKAEILFHMAKDEGYWAAVIRDILQETRKNYA